MAKQVDAKWTRERVDQFTESLAFAGLLRDRSNGFFELHPALTDFLRSPPASALPIEIADAWSRAFVDLMTRLATQLAPKPLHHQRLPFQVWGASLNYALAEASRLRLYPQLVTLAQSMASYALKGRDFGLKESLFLSLDELNNE